MTYQPQNGDRLSPETLKRIREYNNAASHFVEFPIQRTRQSRSIGAMRLIVKIGIMALTIVWVLFMAGVCFSGLPR